jgi:hypothetical protein
MIRLKGSSKRRHLIDRGLGGRLRDLVRIVGHGVVVGLRGLSRLHVRVGQRPAGDFGRVLAREPEEPQHALGVVDVGVPRCAPVEHGAHDGQQGAAGGNEGDLLVGDVQAAGLDRSPEVTPGEGSEGGGHDVVRDVQANEQPAPVGIAAGAAKWRWAAAITSAGSSSWLVTASVASPCAATVSARTASTIASLRSKWL